MAQALKNGADGLEIDVHCTVDGTLVVCHDPTVDDTTDATAGTGRLTTAIAEMTYEEVQGLDAAHWWSPGALSNHGAIAPEHYPLRGRAANDSAFRIPKLVDVIDRFPGVPLNIDLKRPGYEAKLAELLAAKGAQSRSIVASFGSSIYTYRRLAPDAPTAANRRELLTFAARIFSGARPRVPFVAAQIPMLPAPMLRRFVSGAHRSGVAVHVWTIDDEPTTKRLVACGVDGIMTNRSSILTSALLATDTQWDKAATAEIDRLGPLG